MEIRVKLATILHGSLQDSLRDSLRKRHLNRFMKKYAFLKSLLIQ